MRYTVIVNNAQVWAEVYPIPTGKRDVLPKGTIIESTWGKNGYAYTESPVRGYVALAFLQKIEDTPPPEPPPVPIPEGTKLVTAIKATDVTIEPPWGTYANILLRPAPKRVKDTPIILLPGEVSRIKTILGWDANKWKWVAAEDTKRIYLEVNGVVKITSISGYYSGFVDNQFVKLGEYGQYIKVLTLKAGSGWHNNPIPPYLLHNVYGLTTSGKLIYPPCGVVVLPVITRDGFGWISRWQVI